MENSENDCSSCIIIPTYILFIGAAMMKMKRITHFTNIIVLIKLFPLLENLENLYLKISNDHSINQF